MRYQVESGMTQLTKKEGHSDFHGPETADQGKPGTLGQKSVIPSFCMFILMICHLHILPIRPPPPFLPLLSISYFGEGLFFVTKILGQMVF